MKMRGPFDYETGWFIGTGLLTEPEGRKLFIIDEISTQYTTSDCVGETKKQTGGVEFVQPICVLKPTLTPKDPIHCQLPGLHHVLAAANTQHHESVCKNSHGVGAGLKACGLLSILI